MRNDTQLDLLVKLGGEMNDTERLNFLVSNDLNLINDDAGRWACVSDGIQNVPDDETAGDINSTL